MRVAGVALQILSVLIGLFGIFVGIQSFTSASAISNGPIILASSIVGAIILFGIGGTFATLADIAEDVERSADANERTAEALEQLVSRRTRQGQASEPGE